MSAKGGEEIESGTGGRGRRIGSGAGLMNPPHSPYDQVPPKYLDLYKDADMSKLCAQPNIPPAGLRGGDYYRANIRGYYSMISGVDEQFGCILGALEEAGLARNTIVVFTSDHGNCLGIHDEIAKNCPYEESMRVPLLIRWPKEIRPRQDDALLSVPDIMPSLLGMMGLARHIPGSVEGTNFSNLVLTGEGRRPDSQLYLRIPLGKPALGIRGVRTHDHTFFVEKAEGKPSLITLYDNRADPFQFQNIAATSRSLIESLTGELAHWLVKYKDPWGVILSQLFSTFPQASEWMIETSCLIAAFSPGTSPSMRWSLAKL